MNDFFYPWFKYLSYDLCGFLGNDPAIMSRSLDSSSGRKFLSTFEEKHKCGIEVERKKDSTHDLHPVKSLPVVHG